MKSVLKISVSFAILLLSAQTAFGEYTENWEIKTFYSEINIFPDGKVHVTENIHADFSNEAHMGIARYIPYEYTLEDGTIKSIDLSFGGATETNERTGDNGTYTSADGNNTTYEKNGNLVIEMRNAENLKKTDAPTFLLWYTAEKVILFFDEETAKEKNTFPHDEFYWNVNGTEWVVPIDNITATINLPKPLKEADLTIDCLTGKYGETEKNCEWKILGNQTIEFKNTKPFEPYENLTIIIGMPYGTIPAPSKQDELWDLLKEIWPIFIFPIVLIGMIILWHKKGRDEKTMRDTIMPHYTPPKDLLPTEVGTILDEKMDPRDLTATIIDYAVKGYIKINEIEKKGLLFGKTTEYELELIKPYETKHEYEEIIFKNIFISNKIGEKKLLSDLSNKFYKTVPEVEKSIMGNLVTEGYFPASPSKIRGIYMGIGMAMVFIAVLLGNTLVASGNPLTGGLFIGSIILSGMAITFIGRQMPRKTAKGKETYYELKGLYEYINTAEKDRMKFQEENNIIFEKLLPYAMAFGLIKKWSTAFEGILKTPPTWFVPYYMHGHSPFGMTAFGQKLDKMNTGMVQSVTSRPGGKGGAWSGGSGFSGGFSGGGFGGGGGRGL